MIVSHPIIAFLLISLFAGAVTAELAEQLKRMRLAVPKLLALAAANALAGVALSWWLL